MYDHHNHHGSGKIFLADKLIQNVKTTKLLCAGQVKITPG